MKRRGMSAVVTTLIIILLAIVAVGIVWVVVRNLISRSSDDISLTALTLDLEIIKASVDDTTLSVIVKRKSGEGNLVGINFVISDGDNSEVVRKDTTLEELASETFTFDLTQLAIGEITSISIAPIYEAASGKEVVADVVDSSTYESGSLGSGSGGNGGNGGDPGCTPICDGFECGDDSCGGSCRDCIVLYGSGFVCGDDHLCYDESCTPTFTTCVSQGAECGVIYDDCGGEIDCDLELGGCGLGQNCINNSCVDVIYLEKGIIDNVWPPGAGIYFDDDALPKQQGLYYDYSVAFSTNSTQCYPIVDYSYDSEVYPYSAIVQIYLTRPLGIASGHLYEIWESPVDCTVSLPVT